MAGSPFSAGGYNDALAIDPMSKFVYATDLVGGVDAFAIVSGGALPVVSGSTFRAGTDPWAVNVSKADKFAFVADYGSNNVSAYTVNLTSGALTAVSRSPFNAGTSPRGVVRDYSSKFAYVANYGSNNISGFKINPTSGALTAISGSPFGAGTNAFALATCRVVALTTCKPPKL